MKYSQPCDWAIRSNRVVCPKSGGDSPGIVHIRNGLIAGVKRNAPPAFEPAIDIRNDLLLPGLIDLHSHPAIESSEFSSKFGVDPDTFMLERGATTVLSQGDAGASNLDAYVAQTIRPCKIRILLAINLSRFGETALTPGGCLSDLENANVSQCVAAIDRHREHIWGIAVNTSRHSCGDTDPRAVLNRGLEVAKQTELPLLYGMRNPAEWSFHEQMSMLRAGDVVTYCFRRQPHCIVVRGRVDPAICEARKRGILFDVGHGTASFDFDVAEQAIAEGFAPDTISTDLQRKHRTETSAHDLPLVMSKLKAAGMTEKDILDAVTARAAKVLRKETQIGSLEVGACADLAGLEISDLPQPMFDCGGRMRLGHVWQSSFVVRQGTLIQPAQNQMG